MKITWKTTLCRFSVLFLMGLMCQGTVYGLHPKIRSYSAEYLIKYGTFTVGKSTRQLKIDPNGFYTLTLDGKDTVPFLNLTTHEHSRGTWNNGQIRPLDYEYKYQRGNKEKRTALTFDWNAKTVTDRIANKTLDLTLADHMHDNLSFQLALRQDLLAGEKTLSYPVVRHGSSKIYDFKILGKETLHTRLGPLETLKVQRIKNKHTRTTFWLATAYDYLVVRLEHRDDGELSGGEIVSVKYSS